MSWTSSGIIIIDILDPVPAEEGDVDMLDGSDHRHPLESLLPIIRSLLQTFMQPIFPQDFLLGPFKYCKVFVECRSLLEPQQGSTFHVYFLAFYRAVSPFLLRKFLGCTVRTDISSVSKRQWG
jgi:hypothetical protein